MSFVLIMNMIPSVVLIFFVLFCQSKALSSNEDTNPPSNELTPHSLGSLEKMVAGISDRRRPRKCYDRPNFGRCPRSQVCVQGLIDGQRSMYLRKGECRKTCRSDRQCRRWPYRKCQFLSWTSSIHVIGPYKIPAGICATAAIIEIENRMNEDSASINESPTLTLNNPVKKECSTDEDCDLFHKCGSNNWAEKLCELDPVRPCSTDKDCDLGYFCQANNWAEKYCRKNPVKPCSTDEDCELGYFCAGDNWAAKLCLKKPTPYWVNK